MKNHWRHHPGVRSGGELTFGERSADHMRNIMGSWGFIFGALIYLGVWISLALMGVPIDNPQLTILNLVLSCVAALQGGILLIAAKRADQVSAEAALHHYEETKAIDALLQTNTELTKALHDFQITARLGTTKGEINVNNHGSNGD